MTERNKTARNEIRKINATYNNNVAVGLTIAGYWTPAIAFSIGSFNIAHKLRTDGFDALDPSE